MTKKPSIHVVVKASLTDDYGARITAQALTFNAATKIDFGSAAVPVGVPEETS